MEGADQSAFRLPHFVTKRKYQNGHALKVNLTRVLDHRLRNMLYLFTITERDETGASYDIDAIDPFINHESKASPLPSTLYVKLDNCSRENKNWFLFAYIENLVAWSIMDEIEVAILPVGHTNEAIEQAFRKTAEYLRSHDAVTLEDLHSELRETYNRPVLVAHMIKVITWSQLCLKQHAIRTPPPFLQFRYISFFIMLPVAASSDAVHTSCNVRITVTDE